MDGFQSASGIQGGADQETYASSPALSEYVPVMFARNSAQAKYIKDALENCGIPTLIDLEEAGFCGVGQLSRRVPLLVPAEMQHDASELVANIEEKIVAGFDDDEDDLDDDEDFDDDDDDDDDSDSAEDDEDTLDDDEKDSAWTSAGSSIPVE